MNVSDCLQVLKSDIYLVFFLDNILNQVLPPPFDSTLLLGKVIAHIKLNHTLFRLELLDLSHKLLLNGAVLLALHRWFYLN